MYNLVCTDRSIVLRLHIIMLNGMYYGMILNKASSIIDFNKIIINCLTNCKTYCKKSEVELRNEPRCEKTGLGGFPTRSDTNQAVQPQKMARG